MLERGSDRGVEKRGRRGGGVRAESAGCFANRRGSSVNGVNEEWEQTKCAEMKEVPPHCIGRCSLCVSSAHSHRHKHNPAHTPAFSSFTCTLAIPLRSSHFQHLLTQNTLFLHPLAPICTFCCFHTRPSTLPLSHTHTHTHTFLACPLSICFFISPHKVCRPLFSPAAFPLGGCTLRCGCVCAEVKRYSAMP